MVVVGVNADYDYDADCYCYCYRLLLETMGRKLIKEKKKQQHHYFLQPPFLLYFFFQFQRHQKYVEMMNCDDDGDAVLLHLLGGRYEVSTTKT